MHPPSLPTPINRDWRFASRYNDSFWSEEVDRCKELAAQAVFSNDVNRGHQGCTCRSEGSLPYPSGFDLTLSEHNVFPPNIPDFIHWAMQVRPWPDLMIEMTRAIRLDDARHLT